MSYGGAGRWISVAGVKDSRLSRRPGASGPMTDGDGQHERRRGHGLGTTVQVTIDVEDKHRYDATSPARPRVAHLPDVPRDISSGYHT